VLPGTPVAVRQPQYSYYDKIESDHVVQELWGQQDQNTGNQRYQGFMGQVGYVHFSSPRNAKLVSKRFMFSGCGSA
jgi:hypothetical protein